MKALPLLLLALLLGAGVVYVMLYSGDTERGTRDTGRAPSSRPAEPSPSGSPATADRGAHATGAPAREPRTGARERVDMAPAPELKTNYEGTVIGDGAPVPGARIELLRRDEPAGDAKSDERGHFRLSIPAHVEALVLRVRARGFVPVERNLPAKPAGGTELLGNLRLMRGALATGRVLDARGNGIPQAEILIEPQNAGSDILRARGLTGSDGSFEIADAPLGSMLVRARARGYGERAVEHSVGREPKPLEIRLAPGAELRLMLATPHGDPVAGAEVTITSANNEGRAPQHSARSDAQGRVLFEGLGALTWSVRINHPDYRPTGRSQVQANGAELIFPCQPWPAIEGVVRSPGGNPPPPGTKVHALPASAPGDRLTQGLGGQEVDAEGRFRLSGLRQGDWTIRVTAPGFAPTASQVVRLGIEGDGYAGTILLEAGGKLELRLTSDGKPLASAEVELASSKPTQAQLWALQASRGDGPGTRVRSGPEGLVVLSNLAPGEVWVLVFAEGCPPVSAGPFAVSTGQEPKPESVELRRGARLQGRVLEGQGTPLAAAQLRIIERDGRLGFPMTLAADESGRYTTAWLPAGHYSVEAFASADPTLRSGAKELDLEPGELRELDLSL